MRFEMLYNDNIVAIFDIAISLTNIYVNTIEKYDITYIPKELQYIFSKSNSESEKCIALETWIKSRCLSNNDPNLDEKLKCIYHLPKQFSYERLYNYQYLAGFLNYLINEKDNYYVSPVKRETICFAYQDYRFPEIWELNPYNKTL